MAFVLNAQLKIAPPTNLGQLRSKIQSGLNGLNTNVNIKVQGLNNNHLVQINSQLKQMRTNVGSLNKLNVSLKQTGTAARQASLGVASFAENIAGSARRFAAFGVAALAFVKINDSITESVKSFVDYQHELVKIGQVSGDSTATIGKLDKTIRGLAVRFGASSTDIAKAASTLRQAGVEIEDVTKIVETLAKTTNTPSFGNITETAKGVIAIYHQFGDSAREVEDALNKINVASKKYATSSEDYIEVIKRSFGSFKVAGGSLEELIGLFTAVRETTQESAETIGTAFKTIFNRVQSPQVVKQLEAVNIHLRFTAKEAKEAGKNIQGNFVGPYESIKRISEGLSKVSEQSEVFNKVISAFSGDRNLAKAIPLIKELAKAQRVINDLKGAGNSLDEDNLKAQQSIYIQLNKTSEAFKNFFAELMGNPAIQNFIKQTAELTRNLLDMASVLGRFAPILATLGVAKLATVGIGAAKALRGGAGAGPSRVSVAPKFARGGYIPGPNVNQDVVDIKAMPGEYIINKKSSQSIGYDTLNYINKNGSFPKQKLSSGGVVDPYRLINHDDVDYVLKTLGLGNVDTSKIYKKLELSHDLGNHPHNTTGALGGFFDDVNKVLAVSNVKGKYSVDRQQKIFSHELGHAIHGKLDIVGNGNHKFHTKPPAMLQKLSEFGLDDKFLENLKYGKYPESSYASEGIANAFQKVYEYHDTTNKKSRMAAMMSDLETHHFLKEGHFQKITDLLNHSIPKKTNSGMVDIKAMPGEYIINENSARKIGYPELERMNKRGTLPVGKRPQKFAKGGPVPQSGFPSNDEILDDVLSKLGLSKVDKAKMISQFNIVDHIPHPYDPSITKGAGGNYNPDTKVITLSTRRGTRSLDEIKSTLAHEVGHAVHNVISSNNMFDQIAKKNVLHRASELGQRIDQGQFVSHYPPERHQGEGIAETFRHIYDYKTKNPGTFGGMLDRKGDRAKELKNYIKSGHKRVLSHLEDMIGISPEVPKIRSRPFVSNGYGRGYGSFLVPPKNTSQPTPPPPPPPPQQHTYRSFAKDAGIDIKHPDQLRAYRDLLHHVGVLTPTKKGVKSDVAQHIDQNLYDRLQKDGPFSVNQIARGFGLANATGQASGPFVDAVAPRLGLTPGGFGGRYGLGYQFDNKLPPQHALELTRAAGDHFSGGSNLVPGPPPPPPPKVTYATLAKQLGFDPKAKGNVNHIRDLFAHIGVLTPTGKSAAHDISQIATPDIAKRLLAGGPNTFNRILKGSGISNTNKGIDIIAQQLGYSGKQLHDLIAPKIGGKRNYNSQLSAEDSLKYIKAIDNHNQQQQVGLFGVTSPNSVGRLNSNFVPSSQIGGPYGGSSPIGTPRGKFGFQDFLDKNPHIERAVLHAQLQTKYEQMANRRFIPKRFNRASSVYGTPIENADYAINNNLQGHFENGRFTKFAGNAFGPSESSERFSKFRKNAGKAFGAASFGVGLGADLLSQQLNTDTKLDAGLKGGLSGFGGGVIAGGAIGTAFGGPGIGTAIGAIAGAALGATGALKEFEKGLSNQKLASAIDDATNSFKKFSKATSEKEENSAAEEVLNNTKKAFEQIKTLTKDESIGSFKGASNFITRNTGYATRGFGNLFGGNDILSPNSIEKYISKNLTFEGDPEKIANDQKARSGQLITTSSALLEGLQKNYLERHEGAFSKDNPNGIDPKKFLAKGGQAYGFIRQIAELQNPGKNKEGDIKKSEKEMMDKITREFIDKAKVDKSLQTSELIQTNFSELTKSIDSVTAKFNQLQQSTSGITAIFEGVAPQHISRSDQVASFGSNAFEGFAKQTLGGVVDPKVLSQITDASHLQSLLPGILQSLDVTNLKNDDDPEVAKQNAKSAAAQFDQKLKQYGLDPEKSNVGKSASELFNATDDKQKLVSGSVFNPKKISEKFINDAVPDIKNFTKDAIGKFDSIENAFADQYSSGVERKNQGIDNRFKSNSAREEFAHFKNQRLADRFGRSGDADLLGIASGNTDFAFSQRQSELGAKSNNPDQIAAEIRSTQSQINQETEKRQSLSGADAIASIKKLIDLRSKAQNLGKALENLTDVSKTSAKAITLLGKLSEDKDAKRSFIEQYLSSDTSGREQINRAAGTTSNVIMNGSLRGFNAEQQQETIGFLRSVGKGRLGLAGGATGEDVLKQLLDEFGRGSGLDSTEGPEEQALKNIVAQNYEVAIRAQENLSGILQSTNETFFNQLNRNQEQFLNDLKGLFGGGGGDGKPPVGLAKGGPVGTDTVPAMLSPGEFIVSSKAARKHGRLLRKINGGGDVKYLAKGGSPLGNLPEDPMERSKRIHEYLMSGHDGPISHFPRGTPPEYDPSLNDFPSGTPPTLRDKENPKLGDTYRNFNGNVLRGAGKLAHHGVMGLGGAITWGAKHSIKNSPAFMALQGTSYGLSEGINNIGNMYPSKRQQGLDLQKHKEDIERKQQGIDDSFDRRHSHWKRLAANSQEIQSRGNKVLKRANVAIKHSDDFENSYVPVRRSPEIQAQLASNVNTKYNQRAKIDPNEHLKYKAAKSREFVENVNRNQGRIFTGNFFGPKKTEGDVKSYEATAAPTPINQEPTSPFSAGLKAFSHSIKSAIPFGSGRDVDVSGTVYGEQNKSRIRKYGDESIGQQAHRERQQTIQQRKQFNRSGGGTKGRPQQVAYAPQQNNEQPKQGGGDNNNNNNKFAEQSRILAQSLDTFTKSAAPLVEALNSFKDAKIKLEQNGSVNVNITGMEALKSISSAAQKEIVDVALKQVIEVVQKMLSERDSGPAL